MISPILGSDAVLSEYASFLMCSVSFKAQTPLKYRVMLKKGIGGDESGSKSIKISEAFRTRIVWLQRLLTATEVSGNIKEQNRDEASLTDLSTTPTSGPRRLSETLWSAALRFLLQHSKKLKRQLQKVSVAFLPHSSPDVWVDVSRRRRRLMKRHELLTSVWNCCWSFPASLIIIQ